MRTSRIVTIVVLVCALCAAGIYAYAYAKTHRPLQQDPPSSPAPQASGTSVEDGTYAVQIHSILTAGDISSITFSHVTYFEGKEASTSAAHDATCPKGSPLEACVPTLTKGYYVRPSGAPEFTAALAPDSQIALRDAAHASFDMLKSLNRQFDPVFDVVITGGKIRSLTERSPL